MDPWFDADVSKWFSYFSMLALLASTAPLAQRGVYKTFIVGAHIGSVAIGVLLLALGGIAWQVQQPGHVIFPFVFTGILVTLVCGSVIPLTLRAYRDAEARRIVAKDL